jgi:hypothetical protein
MQNCAPVKNTFSRHIMRASDTYLVTLLELNHVRSYLQFDMTPGPCAYAAEAQVTEVTYNRTLT